VENCDEQLNNSQFSLSTMPVKLKGKDQKQKIKNPQPDYES